MSAMMNKISKVLTLSLTRSQQLNTSKKLTMSYYVLWTVLPLWHNRNRFYRELPCFIHSSDRISAVLCMSVVCECYLGESQRFRKFHSQSQVNTRQVNTDQSTPFSRGKEVDYLWYLFVTTFVLIPTSNTSLYFR